MTDPNIWILQICRFNSSQKMGKFLFVTINLGFSLKELGSRIALVDENIQIHELKEIETADLLRMTEDEEFYEAFKTKYLSTFKADFDKIKKRYWKDFVLIYPIYFKEQLDYVKDRHYFFLTKVNTPLLERFAHFTNTSETKDVTLEQFIRTQEMLEFKSLGTEVDTYYQNSIYMSEKDDRAKWIEEYCKSFDIKKQSCKIFKKLGNRLQEKDLKILLKSDITPETMFYDYRPNFQVYYMHIAYIARKRSNCMKRAVGALVVDDSNRILSIGYNGTPEGIENCFSGGCKRCNENPPQGQNLDMCVCVHAEENAINEVGRKGAYGHTLYTTLFPCTTCAKKIVQSVMIRITLSKLKRYITARTMLIHRTVLTV